MKNRKAGMPFILITVFLDILGIGVVIPVLPALIGTFTGSRELQSYWYGACLAAYGGMQFFSAPLLGALSDRFGRRPVLLISIFGLGFNFLLTAISPWLWLLFVSRLLGGMTGASYSVANAYVADITEPEKRAKRFGLLGAAFGLGFVCGPMIGGLLSTSSLRCPYFFSAALSLLNWLYGYFVLPESLPRDRRSEFKLSRANPFSALIALAKLRSANGLVLIYTLTVFPQFIVQCTWVLYTQFRFGWGPGENGISLFVVGLTGALVQGLFLGRILNVLGSERTTLLGMTSGLLAYIFYGLVTQGWMMYVIIIGNALGFLAGPALQGLISKAVDPREQGITMGSLSSIGSLMGVIGPLIGTPILAKVSHLPASDWRVGITFFLCAGVQAMALVQACRRFRTTQPWASQPAETV